jgi:hypothetical protein
MVSCSLVVQCYCYIAKTQNETRHRHATPAERGQGAVGEKRKVSRKSRHQLSNSDVTVPWLGLTWHVAGIGQMINYFRDPDIDGRITLK